METWCYDIFSYLWGNIMTNSIDKVLRKVKRLGAHECWPWTGYVSKAVHAAIDHPGYGRIDLLGLKGVYAHRIAYLAAHPGSITLDCKDGLFVLHRCDNPICCNPKHLFLGTNQDNIDDKVKKGRCPDLRGTRCYAAKLSEEDVREIRRLKPQATLKALAFLYDVSRATICGCLYGRHYQDVV